MGAARPRPGLGRRPGRAGRPARLGAAPLRLPLVLRVGRARAGAPRPRRRPECGLRERVRLDVRAVRRRRRRPRRRADGRAARGGRRPGRRRVALPLDRGARHRVPAPPARARGRDGGDERPRARDRRPGRSSRCGSCSTRAPPWTTAPTSSTPCVAAAGRTCSTSSPRTVRSSTRLGRRDLARRRPAADGVPARRPARAGTTSPSISPGSARRPRSTRATGRSARSRTGGGRPGRCPRRSTTTPRRC